MTGVTFDPHKPNLVFLGRFQVTFPEIYVFLVFKSFGFPTVEPSLFYGFYHISGI